MTLEDFIDSRLTDLARPAYAWDDWDSNDNWMWDPARGFLAGLSDSAQVALTLGSAVWILRRLSAADDDPTPGFIVEAGWAYIVSPHATIYYETTWENWLGPVRGPLGVVCDIVMDALFARDASPNLEFRSFWMANLARYVLADQAGAFDEWFDWAHQNLLKLHPRSEMPVPDLFDPFPPLHPVVGRNVLIPNAAYDPATARAEIVRYLCRGARNNPFISYVALSA
jgi:hypothetical protein